MRHARRARHRRPVGEVLTDLYTLIWLFLVYGGVLVAEARQHLATTPPQADAEPYWIAAAALLATAGLAWNGLRTLGPLLATPAEQAWGVSTPIDRRSWLLPRLALVLTAGVCGGAASTAGVGIGLATPSLAWTMGAGGLGALALVAAAASVQGGRGGRHGSDWFGTALLGAGAVTAVMVVAAHNAGRPLPTPGFATARALALIMVPLAGVSVVAGVRRLRHVDLQTRHRQPRKRHRDGEPL